MTSPKGEKAAEWQRALCLLMEMERRDLQVWRLKLFSRSGFKQIRWNQTCVHLYDSENIIYNTLNWNRSFLMFPQALDEESAASQLDNSVRMKLQKLPLWKYVGVVVFLCSCRGRCDQLQQQH